VIPIAKKSDPLVPKDSRPISILPALCKALKMVMRDQIVSFLDCAQALDRFQSGFRKCHSTDMALLGVSDDIYRMLDQKMVVALLLLDISKAFDSVDHELPETCASFQVLFLRSKIIFTSALTLCFR
jgi:hypothetical protein